MDPGLENDLAAAPGNKNRQLLDLLMNIEWLTAVVTPGPPPDWRDLRTRPLENANGHDLFCATLLLQTLCTALDEDDSSAWGRIRDAASAITNLGITGKRCWVLSLVETAIDANAAGDPSWLNRLADDLIPIEPAFTRLSREKIATVVKNAHPHDEVKAGGAGRLGPPKAAARLAVSCGAFGDTDVSKSKQAFLTAANARSK